MDRFRNPADFHVSSLGTIEADLWLAERSYLFVQ